MARVADLSAVTAPSEPVTPAPAAKRIAWTGGVILTNKHFAMREFLKRKLAQGAKLTADQMRIIEQSGVLDAAPEVADSNTLVVERARTVVKLTKGERLHEEIVALASPSRRPRGDAPAAGAPARGSVFERLSRPAAHAAALPDASQGRHEPAGSKAARKRRRGQGGAAAAGAAVAAVPGRSGAQAAKQARHGARPAPRTVDLSVLLGGSLSTPRSPVPPGAGGGAGDALHGKHARRGRQRR